MSLDVDYRGSRSGECRQDQAELHSQLLGTYSQASTPPSPPPSRECWGCARYALGVHEKWGIVIRLSSIERI